MSSHRLVDAPDDTSFALKTPTQTWTLAYQVRLLLTTFKGTFDR